jgi:hypothetical protein
MKQLSSKMVMAFIIHKIHVIFSKCDNVIENIQIHMWWQIFLFCLKFCTNVKNKYGNRVFEFFGGKNIRFAKN